MPWALSDLDTSMQEFFSALSSTFPSDKRGVAIKERLSRYAKRVSPVAHLIPGMNVAGALEALERQLTEASLDSQRSDLIDLMEKSPQKVAVIVDDIDRLHPDELLLVFKLVRLVGRLPGVYYVLAFDESSLIDVLTQTPIARSDRQRALRFIEKIVQVRVDLPPLHEVHIDQLVDDALGLILKKHRVHVEEDDWSDFSWVYQDHLRRRLTEPRSIKRYFGQVDAYWHLVAGEVNFSDFLLLTFLRTHYPGVYRSLAPRKDSLTLPVPELEANDQDDSAVGATWQGLLEAQDVTGDEAKDVLHVIAHLFPRVARSISTFAVSGGDHDQLYRRKKVGSAEYFDRYFQFAVPGSDVPDKVVAAALQEIRLGERGAATDELLVHVPKRADHVISKLISGTGTPSAKFASQLLYFLAEIVDELGTTRGFLSQAFSPKNQAVHWAGSLVLESLHEEPIDVKRLLGCAGGPSFLVRALRHARKQEDHLDGTRLARLNKLTQRTAISLRERFADIFQEDLGAVEDELWLLGMIAEMESDSATRDWFCPRAQATSWSLPHLLGIFVAIGTSYGNGPPEKILGSYSGQYFEALLGADQVRPYFNAAGGPLPRGTVLDENDVSLENRLRRAREQLAVAFRE